MSNMISLKGLSLYLKDFSLREINLTVAQGEYFVLAGPNGSGKTLLLECICGLRRPDQGIVKIKGIDVINLDPACRNIGYVPQDYALIPFKTVEQNISFGLQARRMGREYITKQTDEMMRLLGIEHLRERLPNKLSGGERQKVALGRALAIKPDILLLDEPLSALDEKVRDSLCREFKKIQQQSRVTVIHVCHSVSELLEVAERVGILFNGKLVQAGSVEDVFCNPKHPFLKERFDKLIHEGIKNRIQTGGRK